jgi:glycosyltransferase involved in cell wall biosynthesis
MKVLFLSNQPLRVVGRAYAYNTRLAGLRRGLESLGIQTNLLSLRRMRFSRPHLLFPLNARAIARRAQGYDVIHAGDAGATVAAAAASLWHPHRVIFDVHGHEPKEAQVEWRAQPTPRRAYLVPQAMLLTALGQNLADMLLVVSEVHQQRYQEKGIPAERIVLVRNGVDTSVFRPAPLRGNGPVHVCYAGGFQAWQAVDVLVDAFLQTADDRLHFHLIGFSPQDRSLKVKIAAHLGNHATLEDWLPTKDLVERLGQADVLIIPRTQHPAMRGGFPSKFAEYLAMGKPLIVTDVDETARFVREYHCGLVCEPTADSLSRGIRQAATWNIDERRVMGRNARQLAESVFDWQVIARDYLGALQEIVQHRNSRYGRHRAGVS